MKQKNTKTDDILANLSTLINHLLTYSDKIPIGKDDLVYACYNDFPFESQGKKYNVFKIGYSHTKMAKDNKKRKQLEKAGQEYTVLDWCKVKPNADITIPGIKITSDKKPEEYMIKEDGMNPYFTGVKYLSFLTLLTDWQMEPSSIFESGTSLKKNYLKYNDKQYVGVESLALEKDDSKYGGLRPAFSKYLETELRENDEFCLDLLTSEGFKRIPVDYALLDYALKNEVEVGLDKNIAPNVGYNIYNRMNHDDDVNQEKLAEFIGAIEEQFMVNPTFLMAKMVDGMVGSIRDFPGIKQGLNYWAKKRQEKTNNY